MGVAVVELLHKEPIKLDDLRGKVVMVDAYNILYQFLTTIRSADGEPLKDANGRITSHLVGLFSRTTNLIDRGVRLAFVFDGEKPVLKTREIARRVALKDKAAEKYANAVEAQDVDAMKKYKGRTARLTPELVAEAKTLLRYLGIPVIDAPSEAEAQAARYVREGVAYAVASQDADCLLFGAPRYIRNLSVGSKRKVRGQYITVEPEVIELSKTLSSLAISYEQFVLLAILVGTDFNPGGIKGIGPKKGLALVKEHPDPESLFAAVKWDEHSLVPWQDVLDVVSAMPTHAPKPLSWGSIDKAGLETMLRSRGFSAERFAILDKLKDRQRGLGEFV